jgi:CheY-like chemotaxis protein
MQGDRDRAMDSGCDDFATKPIEFAALLDKIDRALGAGGSART